MPTSTPTHSASRDPWKAMQPAVRQAAVDRLVADGMSVADARRAVDVTLEVEALTSRLLADLWTPLHGAGKHALTQIKNRIAGGPRAAGAVVKSDSEIERMERLALVQTAGHRLADFVNSQNEGAVDLGTQIGRQAVRGVKTVGRVLAAPVRGAAQEFSERLTAEDARYIGRMGGTAAGMAGGLGPFAPVAGEVVGHVAAREVHRAEELGTGNYAKELAARQFFAGAPYAAYRAVEGDPFAPHPAGSERLADLVGVSPGEHYRYGGDACTVDPATRRCSECGVIMDLCTGCGGHGYHRSKCKLADVPEINTSWRPLPAVLGDQDYIERLPTLGYRTTSNKMVRPPAKVGASSGPGTADANWPGFSKQALLLLKDHMPVGKHLGCGSWGCVYSLPDNRILKITGDTSEAAAVARFLDAFPQGLRGVVHYRAVYGIERTPLWAVVADRAKGEIPEAVADVLDEEPCRNALLDEAFNEHTTPYDWRAHIPKRYHAKLDTIVTAITKMRKAGITFTDLHSGNVMVAPNGDWIIVDIGLSQGLKPRLVPTLSHLHPHHKHTERCACSH